MNCKIDFEGKKGMWQEQVEGTACTQHRVTEYRVVGRGRGTVRWELRLGRGGGVQINSTVSRKPLCLLVK